MCHLAGYIGEQNAVPKIIDSLRIQEGLIGAQATGLAVLKDFKVKMEKDIEPVSSFVEKYSLQDFEASIGIGHTRYEIKNIDNAETNTKEKAHPFWSSKKKFVTMHNGTLSNYLDFVKQLEEKGYSFQSKSTYFDYDLKKDVIDFCDSEIFGYQLEEELKSTDDLKQAIKNACENIRGHYAFVILHPDYPDRIYIANWMQPMYLGTSDSSSFFSSFEIGLKPFSDIYCKPNQSLKNSLITLTKDKVSIEKLLSSREIPNYKPDFQALEELILEAIDNKQHSLPATYVYLIAHLEKISMTREEFDQLSTIDGYTFTPALYQAFVNLEDQKKIVRRLIFHWEGGFPCTPRYNFYRV
ncbi:MAG: hypothetical protein ACTSQK_07720 [Candidatus Heimdallarchaeota archaeon]